MANYTTGAQRYNNRMNKIFEESKVLKKKYGTEDSDSPTFDGKSKRGKVAERKHAMAKKMK